MKYYKTPLGFHPRSINSNGGWNETSLLSLITQPILAYADTIKSPVLMIHGEKAHSRYFSASTAFALENKTMQMKIGEKEYSVALNDNNTTKALQELLPMTIKMSEFNGNEKYYHFSNSLPSRPEHIWQIKSGDVML